jgi:hypothetical protein
MAINRTVRRQPLSSWPQVSDSGWRILIPFW